jgi:hypothetical protein
VLLILEGDKIVFSVCKTYIATVDFLVGVFGHLLLEQLVRRVLSYHGRHDGYVIIVVVMGKLSIVAETRARAKDA